MKRSESLTITRSARRVWSQFDLPYGADEVVDAFFDLPDDQIRESTAGSIERPAWHVAHGRVFGKLVMIGGFKDADGAWIVVHALGVVG